MMGIAIKKESMQGGVSEVSSGVNVMDFFQKQILPELQDSNHASRPVLKATSLKFVSVFRNQFPREKLSQLMPMIISHLSSPVVVVHTFAAYAIERILITKEEATNGIKVQKFGKAELQPVIEPLFTGLFAIIGNFELNENDYAMKCIMRSLATAADDVIPVTQIVVTKLTETLGHIAKNPSNPQFNHYLFESIAVLVRSVCSKDPHATSALEPLLFEPFNTILHMQIAEFTPYVFQILAQLLEYRPAEAGLGQAYNSLFAPLLTPALWEAKGNVPALTRLLQAYINKDAPGLVSHLNPILGVFQKLLASKATEVSAMEILNSVITHFPAEEMRSRNEVLFRLLLIRLQSGKTPRYVKLATDFFALFVGKHGPQAFLDCTNAMQPGLGMMVLSQVWAPRLKDAPPNKPMEAKAQVVGVTKLLCESPALLADTSGQNAWTATLVCLMMLLTSNSLKPNVDAIMTINDPEMEISYDAQFSRLVYATKEADDPFPEIVDPTTFFVQSLHRLLSSNTSQLMPLIQQGLSVNPKLSSGLESMFQQAGLRLS